MSNPVGARAGGPAFQRDSTNPPHVLRTRFLQDVLGLSHDPFLTPVAEQEVNEHPQEFFRYFVKIGNAAAPSGYFERLMASRHTAIFGSHGSGKTTLRLNLARELRKLSSQTLSVTCELNQIDQVDGEQMVLGELAKDLLIDVFERFNPMIASPTDRVGLLAGFLHYPPLKRLLQRIVSSADGESLNRLWESIGRFGSPRVVRSSAPLRAFARALQEAIQSQMPIGELARALNTVYTLGYTRCFILVDSVDAVGRSLETMEQSLAPFWMLAERNRGLFFLKLFLPLELADVVEQQLDALQPSIGNEIVVLSWSEEQLTEMFRQRLRSAESPQGDSIDVLFKANQEAPEISRQILMAAQQSPRRLLRLLSAVIDAHLETAISQPGFTREDWERARRRLNLA